MVPAPSEPSKSSRRTSAQHPTPSPTNNNILPGATPAKGKQPNRTAERDTSPISRLPPELLAHCFALLPAGSLLAATLVSKAWSHVATDEASWRSAFFNYYAVPEDGLVPGRRLDGTWRGEYLLRTRLIRRWMKSRSAALTYDAHAGGHVTDLVVSLTDAMALSGPGAAASRSDPLTSRILRTGIHGGAAPGQITAVKANERGTAIAWGCRDGDIRVSVVCAPVSRPLALSNLGTDASKHRGPVTALAFAPYAGAMAPARTTFASTAVDGVVKVWDAECTPSSSCLFSSSHVERMRRSEDGDVDVGLALAYAPSQRTVVVGTEGGAIYAWRLDGQWASKQHQRWTDVETRAPIASIYLDTAAMTTSDDYAVLFRRMGSALFERLYIFASDDQRAKRTTRFGVEGGGPISAVAVDFASPKAVTGFGSRKYVVAADEDGGVALYLWDGPVVNVDADKLVAPIRVLQKRSTGAPSVTALALSDLLVFVGSIDGTIKCYDPLTGQLVRAISDRSAPRPAMRALAAGLGTPEERERFAISMLRATRAGVVASAGSRIVSWRVDDAKSKGKKRKLRVSTSSKPTGSRLERLTNDREMQQDVHEVQEALVSERQARIERAERRSSSSSRAQVANLNDMTEDEAVAYAILLSAEEADAAAISAALDEDMAMLSMDDIGDDEDVTAVFTPHRLTGFDRRRRPSSRATSSASSMADEAIEEGDEEDEDDHDSFLGGASPASIASNRYYALSPRLQPTAMAPPPDFSDDVAFPIPSPRTRSPLLSPVMSPSPGPGRRYSEAAARAGTSPSPTTLSFNTSPAMSPVGSRRSSARPAVGDDADLQFAIELSLAEARSRLDSSE